MPTYYPSIFFKNKYASPKKKGYQATDYNSPYPTKAAARAEARRRIAEQRRKDPNAKHVKFSAHVATVKNEKSSGFSSGLFSF